MSTLDHLTASVKTIVTDDGYLRAEIHWTGADLDRSCVHGISLGKDSPRKRALSDRLTRAVACGAAHTTPQIKADVNGNTYVDARCRVLGRHLNADLKRLGF